MYNKEQREENVRPRIKERKKIIKETIRRRVEHIFCLRKATKEIVNKNHYYKFLVMGQKAQISSFFFNNNDTRILKQKQRTCVKHSKA